MRNFIAFSVLVLAAVTAACSEGSIDHVGVSLLGDDPATTALTNVLEVYNLGTSDVGPVDLVVEQIRVAEEGGEAVPDARIDFDPDGSSLLQAGQSLRVEATLDTLTVDYGRYVAEMRAEIGSTDLDLNLLFEYEDPAAAGG
jgi:hypothetical protein